MLLVCPKMTLVSIAGIPSLLLLMLARKQHCAVQVTETALRQVQWWLNYRQFIKHNIYLKALPLQIKIPCKEAATSLSSNCWKRKTKHLLLCFSPSTPPWW